MKSYAISTLRERYDNGDDLSNDELGIMFQHYVDSGLLKSLPEHYLHTAQFLYLIGVINLPNTANVNKAFEDAARNHRRRVAVNGSRILATAAVLALILPVLFLLIVHGMGI